METVPERPGWAQLKAQLSGTPLVAASTLGRQLKIPNLFLKDETRTPAGTAAGRLVAHLIDHAVATGHRTVSVAAQGPVALTWARLAKVAGVGCVLFAPHDAQKDWLDAAEAQAARVVRVDADEPGTTALESALAAKSNQWFDASAHPATRDLRLRAYHALGAELLQPSAPGAVAVPTRDGTMVAGMWDGMQHRTNGDAPRLIAATTKMGNPIVWSLAQQDEECNDLEENTVFPSAISEPLATAHAGDGTACMQAVRATGGWGYAASDAELENLAGRLEREEKITVLPAATAGIAALQFAARMERLERDERHVAVLTAAAARL